MTSLRPLGFTLMATTLLAAPGCRTSGVGSFNREDPITSRAEETAADLLVEHNRNADKVQSLQAQSSISSANRGAIGGLNGKLALELPRNFKLVLSGPIHDVADIGSNDQEFWFWAKDNQDKAIYYCKYDESGASPVSGAGLQPDWIIEALGLRVITDEEAARIKVKPGKDPGTVILTERQKTTQGDALIKDTVVEEANGRIREHWVFSSDHKTPLAHAVVASYAEYGVPNASGLPNEKVYLPRKIKLEWMQKEKMAIDVTLSNVKVNPRFAAKQKQFLFVEPQIEGYARMNLESTGLASSRSTRPQPDEPTTVRETLPAPPPRVRLTDPLPLGRNPSPRRHGDPAMLAADFPPAYARGVEEVVGPPIPTVSDPLPHVVETRSGWRGSLASGLER